MTQTFPPAADDHEKIRAVIDDWLTIVDESDPDARALLLNAQLAAAAAYPRLTNHDGEGWHLHYRDDVPSLPYVLRAIISLGTSLHLVTRGMSRLGRCQAAPCTNVVADVTRNGRQRFLLRALCEPRGRPTAPGAGLTPPLRRSARSACPRRSPRRASR